MEIFLFSLWPKLFHFPPRSLVANSLCRCSGGGVSYASSAGEAIHWLEAWMARAGVPPSSAEQLGSQPIRPLHFRPDRDQRSGVSEGSRPLSTRTPEFPPRENWVNYPSEGNLPLKITFPPFPQSGSRKSLVFLVATLTSWMPYYLCFTPQPL